MVHLFYSELMEIKDRIAIVRLAMLRERRTLRAPRVTSAHLVRDRRYARSSECLMRR